MLMKNFIFCLAISAFFLLPMGLLYLLRRFSSSWPDAEWHYFNWQQLIIYMLLAQVIVLPLSVWYNNHQELANSFAVNDSVNIRQTETVNQGENLGTPVNDASGVAAMPEFAGVPLVNTPAEPGVLTNLLRWSGWRWLAVVWLGMAALLFAGRLAAYLYFCRRLRQTSRHFDWQAIPLPAGDIEKMRWAAPRLMLRQQNDDVPHTAPFLMGLFKPCLVLPSPEVADGLNERDWQHLLNHELVHYRRHDLHYKWLVLLCQCLHWFNPAVYLAGQQVEQYCEITCDLAVAGAYSEERRRDYMRTILRVVSGAAVPYGHKLYTGMNNDKKQLKRRFEMLSKPKVNNTLGRRIAAAFLSMLLIYLGYAGYAYAARQASRNVGQNDSNGIVTVSNGIENIVFENEPFVSEDGTIYLSLRETLEKFGIIGADDGGLQYQDGLVTLELWQPVPDAAGGRVMSYFYQRQFSLTDDRVGAKLLDDVIYVPAEMFMGMAQMSAAGGGDVLDGLMIIEYDKNSGEVMRLVSLPLPSEQKAVHMTLPLAEQFAVATQFLQAWQQGDYQKMQSFCCGDAIDKVSWEYADIMLGRAAAAYAEQLAAEPNTLFLHVMIIGQSAGSSYGNRALELEFEQQTDGSWLISSLRSSDRDDTPLSDSEQPYWQWPLQGDYHLISYGFDIENQHDGIDIPAPGGRPVYAAAAGVVQAAGYMADDGNKIILQHPAYGAWETSYSHLSGIAVQAGDTVQAGQVIGYVGSTGNSTGNHLHFAIMQDGQAVDPLPFFEE